MFEAAAQKGHQTTAQYPDAFRFRLPHGYRDRVKQAAQAERVPVSEFIRRAIGDRIERLAYNGSAGCLRPVNAGVRPTAAEA